MGLKGIAGACRITSGCGPGLCRSIVYTASRKKTESLREPSLFQDAKKKIQENAPSKESCLDGKKTLSEKLSQSFEGALTDRVCMEPGCKKMTKGFSEEKKTRR